MNLRLRNSFLLLVLVQGIHSVEEYFGQLWEVLVPAAYLTGLVADDHETGFLVLNSAFLVLGLLIWYFIIRKDHPAAPVFLWFWAILEFLNGLAHPLLSIVRKSIVPGLFSAFFLLFISAYMLSLLIKEQKTSSL